MIALEFASLRFLLCGMNANTERAVRGRFSEAVSVASDDVDGRLMFCEAAPMAFPPVDMRGREETFALTHATPGLAFDGRLCRGTLAIVGRSLHGRVEHAVLEPAELIGVVENVLRMACSLLLRLHGGLLLHSAAIARDNRALVLVGRSGAGKSTASSTAARRGDRVLSDELNALFIDDDGVRVAPVPFAGDHGGRAGGAAFPVAGLVLLEQGEDRVTVPSRARAAATIVAATPFLNTDPTRSEELMEAGLTLCSRIVPRTVALGLGSDPWDVAMGKAV